MTNLLEWVRGGFPVQELLSCILKTEEELVSFMPSLTHRAGSSYLWLLSPSHAGQEAVPSSVKTQVSWILL